jgi:FkbM family methyltransferase
MLASAVGATLELGNSLRRVRNSAMPAQLRPAVILTAMRLRMNRGHLPNPMRLCGFNVSYFRLHQLQYLFNEIFVNEIYRFSAGVENPVIIDCGSNIGISILFFKTMYPRAEIIGFEPDPATFLKLRENIQQNDLTGIVLHQCALSDRDGEIDFFYSSNEPGALTMSTLEERLNGERISVPSRRLSSFITGPVDLLKIDIEGAEQRVLTELAESGKLRSIRQIHLEYHHHLSPDVDTLSSTLALLEHAGFGYTLTAERRFGKAPEAGAFQDVGIYCYRKMSWATS